MEAKEPICKPDSTIIPQKGTDRPALKYLNRHVRTDIATVWYDIGMELLDPRDEQELYVIKNSSSKDMVKCTEMFELWLRRKPNASWNSLIEAFRAPGIELGTLASKIESMLSKEEHQCQMKEFKTLSTQEDEYVKKLQQSIKDLETYKDVLTEQLQDLTSKLKVQLNINKSNENLLEKLDANLKQENDQLNLEMLSLKEEYLGSKVEDSLTEDQEKIAFQLAMRDGVSNSSSFQLNIFGPANSGKTCLVDTLFGDAFRPHEAGTDIYMRTIYATNWQKSTLEQMAENIEAQFLHGLKISAKEQVKSSSFQAALTAEQPGVVEKLKSVFYRSSRTGSTQIQRMPEVRQEEIKQAKAVKIISQNKFTAIVRDFTGQMQTGYLSSRMIFIAGKSVIFIVFKASRLLSDLIKARPGNHHSVFQPVMYSQFIHYWLQSIASVSYGTGHMSVFLPTAVLIATHIDEIEDLEQAKEAIITHFAKELEGKPYAKHLAGNLCGVSLLEALRKFCIFLSNKFRNENVINQLRDIVLQISAPTMKEEHPLIYLKIEKKLLLLRKEVITTAEFHKVAVENGFMATENSAEMQGALDHFRQKGVIIHFSYINCLKELVFLSPQWLEKLIAFLIIAYHYKPTEHKDDHSYRRLKDEGILVGSFLEHSLQMFNKLYSVIGCGISFNQAIAILRNFGFIIEINNTTEFLEECYPLSQEESRIFIVPSQLPVSKEDKKSKFIQEMHVWSIYFKFMDGFIPLTIFYGMVASCINWNSRRNESIVWLLKYEIMLVLNRDQYYSVTLCEEKSSIQVDIMLRKYMRKSCENRKRLIDFFQVKLQQFCYELKPASSLPIVCIQCPHCDKLHLKLINALEGRTLLCNMIHIPPHYYQDLFREFQDTSLRRYSTG